MGGFSNSVVGGVGALVRKYIKSPNYAPGAAGWSINQDGTAEFQSLLARGDLSGSTLTIPAGATTGKRMVLDSTGITFYDAANTKVMFLSVSTAGFAYISQVFSLPIGGSQIQLADNAIFIEPSYGNANAIDWLWNVPGFGPGILQGSDSGVLRSAARPDTIQFGSGVAAGYYYEEWTLPAQITAIGAYNVLKNMVLLKALSDYPTAMNTGTGGWTCPVSGVYTFTMALGFTTWAAVDYYRFKIIDFATSDVYGEVSGQYPSAVSMIPPKTLTLTKFITAGQVLTFQVFTTAARTIATASPNTGRITIMKHL